MMETYREMIEKTAAALEPELRKLALDIHANPEMGNQEVKACRWQTDLLKKYGFEVEQNFVELPTAYRATYKGKKAGPKIAMLAEYDALPELGHGCGHNLIATMAVGSGLTIRPLVEELGGQIDVIGTPAEESTGAKIEMTRRGAFDSYDVIMMAHPFEENSSSINTSAMFSRKFEFFGKTAHAAASPEEGLNALDAMINFFNLINAMRQQTKPDARIHGVIKNGGVAPNIIPDYTSAEFYIRANKVSYVEELYEKVKACAEGAALGTGTTVKISRIEEDFKDTNSNQYLSELACQQMEKLGVTMPRLGATPVAGSSDLGDVSYVCPAIQLSCGMGPLADGSHYGAHTREFERKACSEEALRNALTFVRGFAMTAAELLTNPAHLEAIKKEFGNGDTKTDL